MKTHEAGGEIPAFFVAHHFDNIGEFIGRGPSVLNLM